MKLVIRTTRETNQIHNLLHRTTNIRIIDSTSWSIIRIYNFLQTSKFKRNKVTLDEIRSGFKTPQLNFAATFLQLLKFQTLSSQEMIRFPRNCSPFPPPLPLETTNFKKNFVTILTSIIKKKKKKMSCHTSILATRYSSGAYQYMVRRVQTHVGSLDDFWKKTIRSTWCKKNGGGEGKGERRRKAVVTSATVGKHCTLKGKCRGAMRI